MKFKNLFLTLICIVPVINSQDDVITSNGDLPIRAIVDMSLLESSIHRSAKEDAAIKQKPFMEIPMNLAVAKSLEFNDDQEKEDLDDYRSHNEFGRLQHEPNSPNISDTGVTIPPDTQGAVGLNHIVTPLNDSITISNKATGAVISSVAMNAFWAPIGGNPDCFDPRIAYDQYNNRWIFIVSANDNSPTSAILIAVSATSDPTGSWYLYSIDVDPANLVWCDQPLMGFNKNWITIQANMFNVSNGQANRSHIYVINKPQLYAHGAISYTLFSSASIGFSLFPVQTYDNTVTTQYLIQDFNGNSGGKGYLRLYQITPTGISGAPVFSTVATPVSTAPWASNSPTINKGFAPQSGTTLRVATNDSRIINAVYRNGYIWAAHTVILPANGTPTHTAAQWWQINTAGTVIQRGRIEDRLATATNGRFFYAFPSIAVNSRNDALIGYSCFSSLRFPSAAYSYRLAGDALSTMRPSVIYQAGLANYTKDFNSGRIRWGDYSNTVVDPFNDRDFWTVQEYSAAHSGATSNWGVSWAHLVLH